MDKTILIGLAGRPERFRFDQAAYDRLERYLDRASARLQGDPEREEVIGDLERSLADKLAVLVGADDRVVTVADIDGVLEAIGNVDTGRDPGPEATWTAPKKRRLQRIRQGKQVAGVCLGLAVYAEIDVDWVRWGVVLGSIFTGGLLVIVYIVLIFVLPIGDADAA